MIHPVPAMKINMYSNLAARIATTETCTTYTPEKKIKTANILNSDSIIISQPTILSTSKKNLDSMELEKEPLVEADKSRIP